MVLVYPDPPLSDGVVRLRSWRMDDTQCVRRAATDPRIPSGTTVPVEYTPAEGRSFIERQWGRLENGQGISQVIADAASDEALGQLWIGIRPQPGVAGLGYWLVPDARGRGLATRAVRLAADWALGPLGMARIEAWVVPGNEPSQRVLVSAGFEQEGLLRSFLTVGEERADAIVFARVTPQLQRIESEQIAEPDTHLQCGDEEPWCERSRSQLLSPESAGWHSNCARYSETTRLRRAGPTPSLQLTRSISQTSAAISATPYARPTVAGATRPRSSDRASSSRAPRAWIACW